MCFLAALSAKETAFEVASFEGCFLATLTAISNLEIITLLFFAFLTEPLKALLAVFVTGMRVV